MAMTLPGRAKDTRRSTLSKSPLKGKSKKCMKKARSSPMKPLTIIVRIPIHRVFFTASNEPLVVKIYW